MPTKAQLEAEIAKLRELNDKLRGELQSYVLQLHDLRQAQSKAVAQLQLQLDNAHTVKKTIAKQADAALREVALWRGRFEGACVSSSRMQADKLDIPGQYSEPSRDEWGNVTY